jgi:hypothetical protein
MAITIIGAAYGAVDGGQNMASNVTTTLQNLVNKTLIKTSLSRPTISWSTAGRGLQGR